MPAPYEVRKANRGKYLHEALAEFQRTNPGLAPLTIETVWYQDWSLDEIVKVNRSGWANSTGVYFFSDYCTAADPKGEYTDKRFSFFQRIGLAKNRSFALRLKDYSHFVDKTVGKGAAWSEKSQWGFRYSQLDVIRISRQETEHLEEFFLRTVPTFQNKSGVPPRMVYQPIIFDSDL